MLGNPRYLSMLQLLTILLVGQYCTRVVAQNHLRDDSRQCLSPFQEPTNEAESSGLEVTPRHVFRESAAGLSHRHDLIKNERMSSDHVHEVMFAVQQNNLEELTLLLHDVSDPDSDNYGQHRSREEVEELSSNPDSRDAVLAYLDSVGATVVSQSLYGEYITARGPLSLWEELFDTEFFSFHHTREGTDLRSEVVRAEAYSVPHELHEHVASVFNTVQMPMPFWGKPVYFGTMNFSGNIVSQAVSSLATPELLRSYYNIDGKGSSQSTQAVISSIGQFFSPADLVLFQNRFGLPSEVVHASVDGHIDNDLCKYKPDACIEANLNIQYLWSTCQGAPTEHWYTEENSFSNWLLLVANNPKPPLVISISYGASEESVTASEFDAFNLQAIKLGIMGITVVAASGASSPYVTAVGATQGPESNVAEITCQSDLGGIITSGGGFSTYYRSPPWQSAHIANYFKNIAGTNKVPTAGYSKTGRGYPDVALAGTAYSTTVGGFWFAVSGTSASSPVFAGMVSLVNAARLAAKKPSIGWLNPTLYARQKIFSRDVLAGKNNCGVGAMAKCCPHGFHATPGWDPTTGIGSIDFKLFKKDLMSLGSITRPQTTAPTRKSTVAPSTTKAPTRSPTSTKAPIKTPSPTTKPTLSRSTAPIKASTSKPLIQSKLPSTAALTADSNADVPTNLF